MIYHIELEGDFNMIYDNIYELFDVIKRDIKHTEQLNILDMIGNKELVDYYEENKNEISFDLLKDNILVGYTLNEIKEAYEKVKQVTNDSITINQMLSLNLEIHRLKI
jgi:hypothetical protein